MGTEAADVHRLLLKLGRFELALPEQITVHLDAGYDSTVTRKPLTDLGCEWRIRPKGVVIPINHTRRWAVERTNSWYSRGFNFTLSCTERRAVVLIHRVLRTPEFLGPARRRIRSRRGPRRRRPAKLHADERGTLYDPADGAVGFGDLALLERGGFVLLVDLDERAPAESGSAVFGVLELAVDANERRPLPAGSASVGGTALTLLLTC
ncbi:hypothetical protein ACFXO2_29225 [Streptomyces sp. NPDC059152]|uniref:hypothetical protein n=1 Tax=Streptomyces sp. NPDC059152 TaxID=3346742 RepID=UPI0036B7E332